MTTATLTVIKVDKKELYYAVDACDVSGQYYLCEDGKIVWGEKSGGFPLPDNVICAIPVADPDGSGFLYDECFEQLEELYKDEFYDAEDFDGNLQSYIEDVVCEGGSITGYVEDNYPDHFQQIEEFLREQALEQLTQTFEDGVETWVDEFTMEDRFYSLEIID